MKNCPFCNIDTSKLENTILEETEYFYVLPAIGSLVDGYVMIVSKRHAGSMSELTEKELKEYENLIEKYRKMFKAIYNRYPITFEHGSPITDGKLKANSVAHAHAHIVNHNYKCEKKLLKEQNFKEISSIRDLPSDQNYIFYISPEGKIYETIKFDAISQLMRIEIAKDVNLLDHYDWRKYDFQKNILKTIEKVKKQLDAQSLCFDKLKEQIESCKYCVDTFGFDPHPVFWGKENSKIVQISQAPSNNVHNSGKPFTDMSGKTLIHEWYKISEEEFYNKDNFFIGALAHCYPGKDKGGNDRKPPKCCFDKWVKKELEVIDNEMYIIIGAQAAKTFFPHDCFEDLVFKDNVLNGKPAIVLPHPSPLNRRWIKSHPEFLEKRMIEVRKRIEKVLKESR